MQDEGGLAVIRTALDSDKGVSQTALVAGLGASRRGLVDAIPAHLTELAYLLPASSIGSLGLVVAAGVGTLVMIAVSRRSSCSHLPERLLRSARDLRSGRSRVLSSRHRSGLLHSGQNAKSLGVSAPQLGQ